MIWYGNKKGAYLYEHQTVELSTNAEAVGAGLGLAPGDAACETAEIAGIY